MTTVADVSTVRYSGDLRADALLQQMLDWNHLLPARTTLYYTFDLGVIDAATDPALTAFNAAQQAAATRILNHVSSVCGITFEQTASGADADLHFGTCDIEGGSFAGLTSTRESWSAMPDGTVIDYAADAFIYLDNLEFLSTNDSPVEGSSGYQVLLHEIGHALGLGHPFEGPDHVLPADQDNTDNTVMSYTSVGSIKTTFQAYDLLALRWIYGEDGLRGSFGLNSTHGPSLSAGGGDVTPPTVASFSAAEGTAGLEPGSDLVITFSEAIQRGSGSFTLKTAAGVVVGTYDAAASGNLGISGRTLTIDPTVDLSPGMAYVLEIAAGSVRDLAGNDYAATTMHGFAVAVNVVTGTASADVLTGSSGRDSMAGLDGDDVLNGGAGDDSLDGGLGIDLAVYAAARADATASPTAAGFTVTSAVDGRDTLLNMERLKFADASVALDLSGNAGIVAKILGAVFGQDEIPKDVYAGIGLHYIDGGMSYGELMQLAIDARLGAGASHQAIVELLYTNVVGEPPGVHAAVFVEMLDSGASSVAELGVMAADTDLNVSKIGLVGLAQLGLEYVPYFGV